MRALQPANRVRVGAFAIALVVLVVGVGQSFSSLPMLFATASYYAQFSDSGGLSKGDKVRILSLPNIGHGRAAQASTEAVLDWTSDRFAGKPPPDDCSR